MLENGFQDSVTPSQQEYASQAGHGLKFPSDRNDLYKEWLSMYLPNAFQTAMLNYQNEWNSPLNQMKLKQQAGLNPYSDGQVESASGSAGAAPNVLSSSVDRRNAISQAMNSFTQGVSRLVGSMQAATQIYDYMNYGKDISHYNKGIASYNLDAAQSNAFIRGQEAAWSGYWNTGGGRTNDSGEYIVEGSPRAKYMQASTDRINAQIGQLTYMVNELYPSQKEANLARAALADYQKQVLAGQNDAVLNINTGNKEADTVLRFLCYLIMNNLPSVGFSKKL